MNYFILFFSLLVLCANCSTQKNSINQVQLIRSNSALCIIKLHSAKAAELQSVYSKSPMFFFKNVCRVLDALIELLEQCQGRIKYFKVAFQT